MVKKAITKELLKRLDNLQSVAHKKNIEPIVIELKDWIASSEQGTFYEYIEMKMQNKSPDSILIIDDMILSSDIYVPVQVLFNVEKDIVKQFVQAVKESDEKQFMNLYIKVIEELVELDDLPDNMFFKDFLEHYKEMTIEELVERYKDMKFFKMTKKQG